MSTKKIINDLRQNYPCSQMECPLEPLLYNFSNRLLEQHKCVEKFKELEHKKTGCKLSLKQAYNLWIDEGYAKIFSEVYRDGMLYEELYKAILKKK